MAPPPDPTRREALGILAAGAAAMVAGCAAAPPPAPRKAMPAIFLAHGSPHLMDDEPWVRQLSGWAAAMPRPRSILMLSAHWERRPVTLGATRQVPLVYDFSGFERKYYEVRYPAPGAPELAARVRALLSPSQEVAEEPDRGLDHGAYVPLLAMYPAADVPVLQVSLPTMDAPALLEMGRALAPLREEGVLIVGSGFLTHNLRLADFGPHPRTPAWAAEFDAWAEDVLGRRDADALVTYRARAPGVDLALPTHEHFVPVVVALGASVDRSDPVSFPIRGFHGGSLTRRSVQFG